MNKILLSLGVLKTSLSFYSQSFINGGFEQPMTPISGLVNTYSTSGWDGLNLSPETTSPYQGSQAAKLTTTSDPALNAALNLGDDVISGVAVQTYSGVINNPTNISLSFAYKYTKMGQDTAYVQVTISDTMLAGSSDDVVLYFDYLELGASVASWTMANFTMNSTGNTGTPNEMSIIAVSSTRGFFDTQTPAVGSTLWLDEFQLSGVSAVLENQPILTKVYPNPATDVLNIQLNTTATSVSLIAMDGKVISTEKVNSNTASINVANLVSGMYIYEVISEKGEVIRNSFVKN